MKDWKTLVIGFCSLAYTILAPLVATGSVNWQMVGLGAMVAVLGTIAADSKKTV